MGSFRASLPPSEGGHGRSPAERKGSEMIVLRCLALILALWVATAPAVARIDDLTFGERERIPTAQQQAVIDVLDTETDSGDPVEKIVLDGVRRFYNVHDFDLLWLRNGAA